MSRRESVIMTIQPEEKEMPAKKLTPAEQKKRTAEIKRGVAAAKKEVTAAQKACADLCDKGNADNYRKAVSSHIKALQALAKVTA